MHEVDKFLMKLEWKFIKTIINDWVKRFKDGRESLKNDDGSGKPTTSITEENLALVQEILK